MAQAAGHASSRLLLKRLRDVMAAEATARERLDRIVRLIAADMVAEVCSAYAMRPGEILELIATQGLKPEAVGHTRLRVGEGIVGDIALRARPQALADAQSHPNFAYRPETGEEIFQSLMGVPMLRGGRVQGVLVVQNRAARQYAEEEIEALETIAMVVAELLTGDELARTEDAGTTLAGTAQPDRLEGLRINGGLAIGHAVLHRPGWVIRQVVAEDPLVERRRLDGAIEALHLALDTILESLDASAETREVMEAYRMFARDRGWLHRLREAVAGGLTAEAAVQKVLNDTRARMQQVSDAYLRERLLDLEDLNHRLMSHLVGDSPKPGTRELPAATIVIARSMGPAELLDYDRSRLAGLVLEEGSATAHVAIVARGLDIPVLGRVRGALERIEAGDRLVLAADVGQIILRPGEDVLALFESHAAAREARRRDYAQQARIPAITRDGVQISVKVNAGLLIDAAALEETGADGIGLYRTEIPFMVRQTYPTVEQQTELYGRVLDHAAGKPVTFRTLDIGGDKKLSYFKFDEEENPAMGWRALRIGLDRPSILRQQLRALLTAGAGRQINIMFPMVADVTELDRARALLAREQGELAQRGVAAPTRLGVGAMIEVPALLWQLPSLLPRVDFLSVGSNDLLQFLFAVDRGSPRLAERYDCLSPAVLKLLAELVDRAHAAGVPVSVCGEMAGQPLDAMALVGLGFRELSMNAASVGPVKAMTRSLDAGQLGRFMRNLLDQPVPSLRGWLRDHARDHGVLI